MKAINTEKYKLIIKIYEICVNLTFVLKSVNRINPNNKLIIDNAIDGYPNKL